MRLQDFGSIGVAAALALGVAGALLPVGGAASAAQLVANPNFDLDTPPRNTAPVDWTLTPAPSGATFFVGPGPLFGAFSPPNSANFGATRAFDDVLSQTLNTVPGATYTISFELAHTSSNTANDFSATFGGLPLLSLTNSGSFPYTLFTFLDVATSSSTVLSFAGRENPAWYDLDNVSVTGPVPEPATWAMLILGVAMIGFVARRRREPLTLTA